MLFRSPGGGGGGGLGRIAGPGYVIDGRGILHTIGWQNGKDIQKPAPFLPGGARFSDPIVENNIAYTSTSGNCGGAPNAVWAMDLSSDAKPVTSFKMNDTPIGAVSLTTDGRVVVSSASGFNILEPKGLAGRQGFTQAPTRFSSQPVIFQHGGKDVIGLATTAGRVELFDATEGAKSSSLATSEPISGAKPDALATWQDASGTRWLLVQAPSAIHALKVVEVGGHPSFQSGWVSRDIPNASTPIIVNGVVFAVARGSRTAPAVLYALDGTTGKEIWNSGKTITSFMPGRSFWSANSQVHVATFDGSIFAFGFALERWNK